MIIHIVIWKLKDFAEGKSKFENAVLLKEKLENLKNEIQEIKNISVNIGTPNSTSSNLDVILVSDFETIKDLETYQNHPKHQMISDWISKIREYRYAIDYEK